MSFEEPFRCCLSSRLGPSTIQARQTVAGRRFVDMMDDHRLDSLRQLFKGRNPNAYLTRVPLEKLLAEMQRAGAKATAVELGQATGRDSPGPAAAGEVQATNGADLQEQCSPNGAQEQQSVSGFRDIGSWSGTHGNGSSGAVGVGAATAGSANGAVDDRNGSSTSSAAVIPADSENGSANRAAQPPADVDLQDSSKQEEQNRSCR